MLAARRLNISYQIRVKLPVSVLVLSSSVALSFALLRVGIDNDRRSTVVARATLVLC